MRVAPIATKNCTPTVGFTSLVPTNIPKAPAPILPIANKGQFGAPIVAQMRAPAAMPLPAAAPVKPASKPPVIASHPHHSYSNSLNGRMFKPTLPTGLAAKPAQGMPIASYGNQGYQSGPVVASGNSGSGANASVSGTLIHHR